MRINLVYCLITILLLSTIGLSQSIRNNSSIKTATAYYQYEQSGSHAGIIYLMLDGKVIGFSWWGNTKRYNMNSRSIKVGAEWRIVYEPCGVKKETEETCPTLISATFTGRNLSEINRVQSKTIGKKPIPKTFTVFTECICNCTAQFVSFIYDGDLRINVSLGGCGHDPSVSFTKGQTEKEFLYYRKPTERFVENKNKQKTNATLKKLLLDVYNLGVYCQNTNISSGTFAESGKFTVLNSLRQYLKL